MKDIKHYPGGRQLWYNSYIWSVVVRPQHQLRVYTLTNASRQRVCRLLGWQSVTKA